LGNCVAHCSKLEASNPASPASSQVSSQEASKLEASKAASKPEVSKAASNLEVGRVAVNKVASAMEAAWTVVVAGMAAMARALRVACANWASGCPARRCLRLIAMRCASWHSA
jgi:hypothetical protein